MRRHVQRRGSSATYAVVTGRGTCLGFSIWRRGAFSLLAPLGRDGVPVQLVFGDWWGPLRQRAVR